MRIMDALMTVANIGVMAITPLVLMRFTNLPHWACFVIGVPGGIIAFWLVLFTTLRILKRRRDIRLCWIVLLRIGPTIRLQATPGSRLGSQLDTVAPACLSRGVGRSTHAKRDHISPLVPLIGGVHFQAGRAHVLRGGTRAKCSSEDAL